MSTCMSEIRIYPPSIFYFLLCLAPFFPLLTYRPSCKLKSIYTRVQLLSAGTSVDCRRNCIQNVDFNLPCEEVRFEALFLSYEWKLAAYEGIYSAVDCFD